MLCLYGQNGYIGVNLATPSYHLDVNGTIRGAIINTSDRSLKKDIEPLTLNTSKLNSVQYRYKADKTNQLHYGFIAQEVRDNYPNLVYEDEKGLLSLSYVDMIALLVNDVKEQHDKIDGLKGQIKSQQKQIDELMKLVKG